MLAIKTDVSGVLNVATGQRISVNNFTDMVMEIIWKQIDCVHGEMRAEDVRDSRGDI